MYDKKARSAKWTFGLSKQSTKRWATQTKEQFDRLNKDPCPSDNSPR